ncbi:hypothetical protein LCGC14_2084350 [marine sediment metagenome]|uniref:Uncharacterized protein n=1 Tax=marine sediment metagenome TaxID=412755 RepID=A0A0F9HBN4_9ZZZZ
MANSDYKIYTNERTMLVNAQIEQAKALDKAILALAAGSFGLSLAIVKQFSPIQSNTINFLMLAWIFFAVSILSTLISFQTSQLACSRQIELLKAVFVDNKNKENEKDTNRFLSITQKLNIFSISAFIIGIIFLSFFSIKNVKEVKMENSQLKMEEGFVPPSKPADAGKKVQKGIVPPKTPAKPISKPAKKNKN